LVLPRLLKNADEDKRDSADESEDVVAPAPNAEDWTVLAVLSTLGVLTEDVDNRAPDEPDEPDAVAALTLALGVMVRTALAEFIALGALTEAAASASATSITPMKLTRNLFISLPHSLSD
jgi:hypothetical protein